MAKDVETQEVGDDVESIIQDVAGSVPSLEEPSQEPSVEIDDDGNLIEPKEPETPKEPEKEPEKETKPDEPKETEVELEPAKEPETRAEKMSIFQEKNEWRRRAKDAEDRASKLEEKLNQLTGKVELLTQQRPEEPDPLDELPDDEYISAGQVKQMLAKQDAMRRQQEEQQQEQIRQQQAKALEFIDTLGADIFDDWRDTIEPVLPSFQADPNLIPTVLKLPSAAAAAKYIYKKAKELQTPAEPSKTVTKTKATSAAPAASKPVSLDASRILTSRERDLLIETINNCTDPEVLAQLEARLSMSGS